MDDQQIAKLLISKIIGEKVQSLDFQPKENIVKVKLDAGDDEDKQGKVKASFTVYRLDFSTKKNAKGELKQVIIEIQKAKLPTDIMRLRKYLGRQYASENNSVKLEKDGKKQTKTSTEKRYYISSLAGKAEQINNAVRKHWAVENNLPLSLDVLFKKDFSLKKKGNSAVNFNVILKLALAMLENEKSRKITKPAKRLAAALGDKYREKIIPS